MDVASHEIKQMKLCGEDRRLCGFRKRASVCSRGGEENAAEVGFTAACFSRRPFRKRWPQQQWTFAPSSLSVQESYP